MRIFVTVLIFLAPISAIAAAIYEIVTRKQEPTLFLLLAVIPGDCRRSQIRLSTFLTFQSLQMILKSNLTALKFVKQR